MSFPAKDFSRSEFACKCGCGFDVVDAELLHILQQLRDHYDSPITIHSGCRCSFYNRKVGGKLSSKHLLGNAADFHVKNISNAEVHTYLVGKFPAKYGIGLYSWGVHLDVRSQKARW